MFKAYDYMMPESWSYVQVKTLENDRKASFLLCQEHHTGGAKDGAANGIHEITFPVWVIQKLAKKGEDPVPQDGETPEEVLKEFETI